MPEFILDPWGDPIPLGDWLHPHVLPRASWDDCRFEDLRKAYTEKFRGYGFANTHTNARYKLYRSKAVLQVSNDNIFPTADWEDDKGLKGRAYDVPSKGKAADPQRASEEARRRAKSKVRDIALCNQFTHMLTWTLDKEKVDRYDPEQVYKKVRPFLSNMTQRKGFLYVVIPEYHTLKEGETRPAIHFHGLCSLGSVRIERALLLSGSPRVDKHGRPVYNMTDWGFGWSTVVPLDDDYERAVNYVTKYIAKQEEKILGKYYLSSRTLRKKPKIVPLEWGLDYDSFVDEAKLATGQQYESTVFRDVKIVNEEFDRSNFDEESKSRKQDNL